MLPVRVPVRVPVRAFGSSSTPHTQHRRYQYSKLFDVYDGATSSATSADRAGYYYYVNILSFLRFGYADEDERVWFEGRYDSGDPLPSHSSTTTTSTTSTTTTLILILTVSLALTVASTPLNLQVLWLRCTSEAIRRHGGDAVRGQCHELPCNRGLLGPHVVLLVALPCAALRRELNNVVEWWILRPHIH